MPDKALRGRGLLGVGKHPRMGREAPKKKVSKKKEKILMQRWVELLLE